MVPVELETLAALEAHLKAEGHLCGVVIQALDLRGHTEAIGQVKVTDALFLGCTLSAETLAYVLDGEALVFPKLDHVPYSAYRGHLYTPEELLGDYVPGRPEQYLQTLDHRIYQHFLSTGGGQPPSIRESLARRLHDHAMTDALEEFIEGEKLVGIMGGHALLRTDPNYLATAHMARTLTQKGYLMVSGGGPGAMEATHLGAWFAHRTAEELADAVHLLGAAPGYSPQPAWMEAAFAVRARYPLQAGPDGVLPRSLGIPTWLYGHEPPTAFATHIAKYFANSVREDGILTIARHGVIFTPGSAGTIQEVFQDATQNHYEVHGAVSPMIFYGVAYWTHQKPVYPLLAQLAEGRAYAQWLTLTDDPAEVVAQIEAYAAQKQS